MYILAYTYSFKGHYFIKYEVSLNHVTSGRQRVYCNRVYILIYFTENTCNQYFIYLELILTGNNEQFLSKPIQLLMLLYITVSH